jgi:hypothetical protein
MRSPPGPFVSSFAESIRRNSAKVASLLSVVVFALGKDVVPVPRYAFFDECYDPDTRQSTSLSSVTLSKATNIPLFYLFLLFHPNKQNIYHIYIIDITYIIETTYFTKKHISQGFHKHVYVHTKIHQHKYHTTLKHKFFTNISSQVYHTS